MTPLSTGFKNKRNSRRVFSSKSQKTKYSTFRLFVEIAIMLSTGILLAYTINLIPANLDIYQIIISSWINLTTGFYKIGQAILGISTIILVFVLIVSCLTLLLGAITRSIKLSTHLRKNLRKRPKNFLSSK